MSKTVVLLIVAGTLAACARYEYLTPACPDAPPSRSAIAWQPSNRANEIVGRVVSVDGVPLEEAYINSSERPTSIRTDKNGAFSFVQVAPGTYTIQVRRIGYEAATVRVSLSADGGAQLLAVLEARRIGFDECGYAMIRVRKPWWKFW